MDKSSHDARHEESSVIGEERKESEHENGSELEEGRESEIANASPNGIK